MTVTIVGTTFDQHEHDERGDLLDFSVGDPRVPARTIATSEGHAVDYHESGAVIGMCSRTSASTSSETAN